MSRDGDRRACLDLAAGATRRISESTTASCTSTTMASAKLATLVIRVSELVLSVL